MDERRDVSEVNFSEEIFWRRDEVPSGFDEDGVPMYEAPFYVPRD